MRITIDARGLNETAEGLRQVKKQMPFALSKALNDTANAAQKDVRASLAQHFTLRRKAFIENTIYRKPGEDFATKRSFVAGLRVNPARDVLLKHEDGGAKTPISGRALAIPLSGTRRNKADIVTRSQRPNALRGKPGVFRVKDMLFKRTGKGARRKLLALFLFRRSVPIKPRLGFEATSERTIERQWVPIAENAIERALATMR